MRTCPDEASALVRIEDLSDPDQALCGLPIEDRAGYGVGNFGHLTFQDGGQEEAVITLRNNESVAVDDDHRRFDSGALLNADGQRRGRSPVPSFGRRLGAGRCCTATIMARMPPCLEAWPFRAHIVSTGAPLRSGNGLRAWAAGTRSKKSEIPGDFAFDRVNPHAYIPRPRRP